MAQEQYHFLDLRGILYGTSAAKRYHYALGVNRQYITIDWTVERSRASMPGLARLHLLHERDSCCLFPVSSLWLE